MTESAVLGECDSSLRYTRADQLAALRRLKLPPISIGQERSILPVVVKAVLRAIDDHGEKCWASVATLAAEANIEERTAQRAIQALKSLALISSVPNAGRSNTLVINWEAVATMPTPDRRSPLTNGHPRPMDASPLTHGQATPDHGSPTPDHGSPKARRSEKEARREAKQRKSVSFTADDFELARELLAKVRELDPKANPNMNSWANDFRLLRERDERTADEIKQAIGNAHADQFWKTVVLSPRTLRKNFTKVISLKPRLRVASGPGVTHESDRRSAVEGVF